MIQIYFAAGARLWPGYAAPLRAALDDAGIVASLTPDCADPAMVDYIIFAPGGDISDFSPYTRCNAVLNLWAGVEKIVGNPTLTQPLCRMVDPALTQGMVEWVLGHTLRHHLGMDRHITNPTHTWDPTCPPLAAERPVTLLGMGALGAACAHALQAVGFPVTGWSRTAKSVPDVALHHGDAGLVAALTGAAIVVLLLPKTPATENILNAQTLALLAPGAAVLNPGRGHLIDDAALLAALDTGHLGHATLDVFRTEPLPADHAFWAHPRVTVTPHVAAETRPSSASRVVIENIRRAQAGAPLLHLVDKSRGY
ncbi:glyoxylate/hydroxypyruvate reductase A [Pseudorhodobacter antarcticus]|uniref:Glyoxylate/hydroxypyruvate reductase A n=1 Tax=Pseudorhodobacter antarcticus TaxID=1077947 RepID=A0A1H8B5B4_9RHOB|nr:glyoxylate/hydroxypyruvate reductase A [Pseudorhodobacter antarcticus]SEM78082.1 glyoxylate/hydroxypyruvate reductase A [Pseudorhodobacter antarcticus]